MIWKQLPVIGVFLISLFLTGCEPAQKVSTNNKVTSSQSIADFDDDHKLINEKKDVPELSSYPHSGANDIRDILICDGEFLVATGKGIARYRLKVVTAELVTEYFKSSGLPSDNVFSLKKDTYGGIWAFCEDGVGYLPQGEDRWIAYTSRNGLASGSITNMALSQNGQRVWVTSTGGLATARTDSRKWKTYPIKNPIDILVAPDGTRVWCRRLLASGCMCGRHILTSQLDQTKDTWLDIPDTGNCAHVAQKPVYYCDITKRLWFSGGFMEPPLLFDPASEKTKTWRSQPKWEILENGNTCVYSDHFGQMLPFTDNSGKMWFATGAGLWSYDPGNDTWKIQRLFTDPGCGIPLLTRTRNNKTIYWASEGIIASFDIPKQKWTILRKPKEDEQFLDEGVELVLSPDEKYLWWVYSRGIYVGNLTTKTFITLTDKTSPGLSRPHVLRFDSVKKRALIGTSRGVIITDFAGDVLSTEKRSPCPLTYEVKKFILAPDGSEVWCFQEDCGGFQKSAVILYPDEKRWEEFPDPKTCGNFCDIIFTRDGKRSWLSMTANQECFLLERTPENSQWSPIHFHMPEYFGTIEQFQLNPSVDEIWMITSSSGIYRIKLATGEISRYGKGFYSENNVDNYFSLIENYAKDLIFTSDGRYAICSASGGGNYGITMIDLKMGESYNFSTEREVKEMYLSADQTKVTCIILGSLNSETLDIEKKKWVSSQKNNQSSANSSSEDKILSSLKDIAKVSNLKVNLAADPVDGRYVVCVLTSEEGRSSIQSFDIKENALKMIKDLGTNEATAIKASSNGIVWVALPGSIISIDVHTEKLSEFD